MFASVCLVFVCFMNTLCAYGMCVGLQGCLCLQYVSALAMFVYVHNTLYACFCGSIVCVAVCMVVYVYSMRVVCVYGLNTDVPRRL